MVMDCRCDREPVVVSMIRCRNQGKAENTTKDKTTVNDVRNDNDATEERPAGGGVADE